MKLNLLRTGKLWTAEAVGAACQVGSQSVAIAVVCGWAWWFGGVSAWGQACGALAVGCACVLAVAAQWLGSPANSGPPPRAMICILGMALLLGAIQLVPWNIEWLAVWAPGNAALWRELGPMETRGSSTQMATDPAVAAIQYWSVGKGWPISLATSATRHDLALLTTAVCLFVLGATRFATDRAGQMLLFVVVTAGAALSFFGIAQQLSGTHRLYGLIEIREGVEPFASFVNRNNAGGYLNLCLAAGLGLFVSTWGVWFGAQGREGSEATTAHVRPGRIRRRRDWRDWVAAASGFRLYTGILVCLLVAAVLCTLSRGATVACLLGLGLAGHLLGRSWRHRLMVWAGCLAVLLAGVALAAWVGRLERLGARAESLFQLSSPPDGRWAHWSDGLRAGSHYWTTGSGLGTYRHIYRLDQLRGGTPWFWHAENQYLEAFVEGGIIGLGLLLAAIGCTARACWTLLRGSSTPHERAWGLTGLVAIVTQSFHATCDFGLYLPANYGLLALICGVVHGRAAQLRSGPRSPSARPWQLLLCTILVFLMLGGGRTLWRQAELDSARAQAPAVAALESQRPQVPSPPWALESLLARGAGDAEAHLQAAHLGLTRFRIATWNSLRREQPRVNPDRQWALTTPIEMHTAVRQLAATNRTVDLETWRSALPVREHLVPALRHLLAAREACPLLPEVHLRLAELLPLVVDTPIAERSLARVFRCAPVDGNDLGEAGFVALAQGNVELTLELWRRVLREQPERLVPLLRFASEQPTLRTRREVLLPDDPELLVTVARDKFGEEADRDLRFLLARHAKKLLGVITLEIGQAQYLTGELFLLEDNPQAAIGPLKEATEQRPWNVTWRFALATALVQCGRRAEARDQLSVCIRLEPQNERCQALLNQLIRDSIMQPQEGT